MVDKFALDDINVGSNSYAGFIREAELLSQKHMPGPDTVLSIQLSQSLKEIFISIMNALYMMKEGQPVIYINILDKCIKASVDKYGVPDKSDMIKLYKQFNELFSGTGVAALISDLSEMLDEINSGKFVYEE